jgi:hypothetical protein
VHAIEIEVHPLGGDNFKVTLEPAYSSVNKAKSEIARVQGTKGHRQELYKVAEKNDAKAVREDDAEAELLRDGEIAFRDGDIVALAVKDDDVHPMCPVKGSIVGDLKCKRIQNVCIASVIKQYTIEAVAG